MGARAKVSKPILPLIVLSSWTPGAPPPWVGRKYWLASGDSPVSFGGSTGRGVRLCPSVPP